MLVSLHVILPSIVKKPLLSSESSLDADYEMKLINKAYRKAILLLHPDRTGGATVYDKLLAAEVFAALKETKDQRGI